MALTVSENFFANLVPRVSLLPAPVSLSLALGGGKKRDPGNEVASLPVHVKLVDQIVCFKDELSFSKYYETKYNLV